LLGESVLIVAGVLMIGFLFAPLGLGGGILYVPLLHYIGGWDLDQNLIIVSLLLTTITSYGSGLEHRKQSYVDERLIRVALRGAIPGAIIGVIFVFISGNQYKSMFKILSVVVVGFVIYKMVIRITSQSKSTDVDREVLHSKLAGISAFGGFLSSVMAVGAGLIYVPAMKFFGNLNTRTSIGSSLNVMMVVVPIAIITHSLLLTGGQVEILKAEVWLIALLVLVNFIGAKSGAIIGFKLFDENQLLKLFVGVLSITWLNYVFDLLM